MNDMPVHDFTFTRFEHKKEAQRTEIDFIVRFKGAIPSRDEILSQLALFYGFEKDCAVLDRLRPRSGKKELRGTARFYDDEKIKKLKEK
jgi:small subunit ribosomal protein S24e